LIIRADARAVPLADGCVQTCVTSPPYWGLRDYGVGGQIGLEATPELFVATMVEVFREVRRCLRDDGTVWLNLGDSYAGGGRGFGYEGSVKQNTNKGCEGMPRSIVAPGLKAKDLCGIPWLVAFALQADGWYLRSDIVWAKPNPMPESVTDRPTRSHEYIFLLSKRERYFYDADAIRESSVKTGTIGHLKSGNGNRHQNHQAVAGVACTLAERNKRDVWTINSEPTPEAHFATFPQKLIEPCILAGTSEKGCCAECGAPRVRVTERETDYTAVAPGSLKAEARQNGNGYYRPNSKETGGVGGRTRLETTGWRPSCAHDAPSVPCLVLDPFMGSGTVLKVSERFGRRSVGLELSADYIKIAKRRTSQLGLFAHAFAATDTRSTEANRRR
jgi:DNA modification methylase